MFNKPFITFIDKNEPNDRFDSLIKIFKIKNRIFGRNDKPDIKVYMNEFGFQNFEVLIIKV